MTSQNPMFSAEDTHVSHSATQANDWDQTTLDIYGHRFDRPLAFYDLDTQSWKMFEVTLASDFPQFLATLPNCGMTQNGKLFQRPRNTPRTLGNEFSLWPTPRASMWKNRKYWLRPSGNSRKNLEEEVAVRHPELRGQPINLQWLEWLMGFPVGWTEVEP
jgi:hypothetical protein